MQKVGWVVSGISQVVVEVRHTTTKAVFNIPLPRPCSSHGDYKNAQNQSDTSAILKIDVALDEHASSLTDFVQYRGRLGAKHGRRTVSEVCRTLGMTNLQKGASKSVCQTLCRLSQVKARGVAASYREKHTGS